MTNETSSRLLALLRAKMKRADRLQAIRPLLFNDSVAKIVLDCAERFGIIPPEQPTCGAKTRTGAPCKRKPLPGKKRCRNHGGLSTGPRTPEGKAKALSCLKLRWKNR